MSTGELLDDHPSCGVAGHCVGCPLYRKPDLILGLGDADCEGIGGGHLAVKLVSRW